MSQVDQWENEKRLIEGALAAGIIAPESAARMLRHLDDLIRRRPRILKRRRDRKAWRAAQEMKIASLCK